MPVRPSPAQVRSNGRSRPYSPDMRTQRSRRAALLVLLVLALVGCRDAGNADDVVLPARPPDATVTVDDVRLELWTAERSVAVGRRLSATGRVTNLGTRPIWYQGKPCSQLLTGLVRFPAFDAFGARHAGVAGEVKRAWARGDGTSLERYARPGANSFFGTRDTSCGHEEEQDPPSSQLAPGASAALTVTGSLGWDHGPLPQEAATLGVIFSFATSERLSGSEARVAYASVQASVDGGGPTVSPAAAVDGALTAAGVPSYLEAHAHDTQLSADAALTAEDWIVGFEAIDVAGGAKSVAPRLEVRVDRRSGRVLCVRTVSRDSAPSPAGSSVPGTASAGACR
jgi:hypothetical protein